MAVFQRLDFSNPDFFYTPGRGAGQWHGGIDINVPVEGTHTVPPDVYYRFVWTKIEGRTLGSYTWTYFDGLVNAAISRGQKFDFGIMTVFPGAEVEAGGQTFANGGGMGCYPEYLHNLMQAESVKDWKLPGGQTWTPNYNSPSYHARLLALHQAINTHINNTSFNGVRYKDVVNIIDIRGYGAWGEWHSAYTPNNAVTDYPAGTFPTEASLKKIVDAHTQGFPDHQLVAMIAAFDAHYLNNTWNPPYIADYILNVARNNKGPIGWRRDQWGATDSYLSSYLENNNRNYNNGAPFSTAIMNRWRTAPITGEPPAWNPGDFYDLERQIRLYHASQFGNGNYGTFSFSNTLKNNVRAASKASGYRIVVDRIDPTVNNYNLTIQSVWQNVGIAPTYENWDINYELTNFSGSIVWTGKSSFNPRLYAPEATTKTVNDSFVIPSSVPAGTYSLKVRVADPTGVRKYLPLAITATPSATGRYTVQNVTLTGTTPPPVNVAPVASAGADQSITLPSNSVTVNGSATDSDGTVNLYLWSKITGPVAGGGTITSPILATTTITGLLEGTYTYQLTVTDDDGATGSDLVTITVNPAPVVPPAKEITQVLVNVTNKRVTTTYNDGSTVVQQ